MSCSSREIAFDLLNIAKSDLKDDAAVSYREFARGLRPNRIRIAADLALGLLALLTTAWVGASVLRHVTDAWPLVSVLAAVLFGYWIAYLQLFIHEGAHFNLAADRALNDRICDWLIGIWVGVRVKDYRIVHWEHHRSHGQPEDSEHSYFSPLNVRFLAEAFFGIKALSVLRSRKNRLGKQPGSARGIQLCSVLLHASVTVCLWYRGHWSLAAAWLIGVAMFFPLFGALRQLLEHRSGDARGDLNYFQRPHGKTTRMFSEGMFGSTFGAAGFTRHLLHHWDPSVSYTNLPAVEDFLARCATSSSLPPLKKTSYFRAFFDLYGR